MGRSPARAAFAGSRRSATRTRFRHSASKGTAAPVALATVGRSRVSSSRSLPADGSPPRTVAGASPRGTSSLGPTVMRRDRLVHPVGDASRGALKLAQLIERTARPGTSPLLLADPDSADTIANHSQSRYDSRCEGDTVGERRRGCCGRTATMTRMLEVREGRRDRLSNAARSPALRRPPGPCGTRVSRAGGWSARRP